MLFDTHISCEICQLKDLHLQTADFPTHTSTCSKAAPQCTRWKGSIPWNVFQWFDCLVISQIKIFDIWCYFPAPSNAAQKALSICVVSTMYSYYFIHICKSCFNCIVIYIMKFLPKPNLYNTNDPTIRICLLSSKLKGLGCHAAIFTA